MNPSEGFLARDVLYWVVNKQTWRLKKAGIRH